MKNWLRGGIIALIVVIIVSFLLDLISSGGFFDIFGFNGQVSKIIYTLIITFIIGAIIGWMYEKINGKQNNNMEVES